MQANDTSTIEIVDPVSGERVIIGGTMTTVVIGPRGERAIVEQDVRVRSNDRRVITASTEVFACGCGCNGLPLLVRDSITLCEACRIPIALAHAREWNDGATVAVVCPACWAPGRWWRAVKRFVRWLLQP